MKIYDVLIIGGGQVFRTIKRRSARRFKYSSLQRDHLEQGFASSIIYGAGKTATAKEIIQVLNGRNHN